ncbi:MAG: YjbE family putative metal transport protein [Alphaproteobacteria bacterium]|nr:YjbE family putative metal transport protein [Alphaproteobacteria bacterium]
MIEETVIFIQIVFIDIIMAADNAIIIGMVAANFAPKHRKQIILWGVFAAFIFRVIFAFSATYLFQFALIKLIGGVLLLWIVNDLRQDLFTAKKIKSPTKRSGEPSFINGVYKVLIADITLSFDNVLGVAGAAKDHYFLLFFGLFLSVVLIGAAASYFAKYIKEHQWVGYVGLVVILLVAVQLIIGGLVDMNILSINEAFEHLF